MAWQTKECNYLNQGENAREDGRDDGENKSCDHHASEEQKVYSSSYGLNSIFNFVVCLDRCYLHCTYITSSTNIYLDLIYAYSITEFAERNHSHRTKTIQRQASCTMVSARNDGAPCVTSTTKNPLGARHQAAPLWRGKGWCGERREKIGEGWNPRNLWKEIR